MTDHLIDGVMEERIKNLELKYNTVDKKVENLSKRNSEEHSVFYDRLRDLGLTTQANQIENKNIMETLNEVKDDVKATRQDMEEIKNKPAKQAERFGSSVIASIGSALGGGIVALIAYILSNGFT